mmetsp:Transcript_10053/g.14216  ORF Transcript_10053/g.14216 Transcript_10053/m.14216 type:complete len:103 (+) Transcript_10053:992-1300(+)
MPTICSAPTKLRSIPTMLSDTPTLIALRVMLAALILVVLRFFNRLANRAPPQVQIIDKIEATMELPAKKNPSVPELARALSDALTTLRANKMITELTDVSIT